jgi:hypothetical protein
MLSFDVDLSAPGVHDWIWDGQQWACQAGWVRPFSHPALTSTTDTNGSHTTFTVAEHVEGGDFVSLDVGRTTARVQAGALGRAPVYIRHRDGRLTGSWQITDLMDQLPADALNERAVARALTRRHRYSADTLFPDIIRLTERATVAAGAVGMELAYPEPIAHPARRALKADVDPAEVFARLTFDHLINRGVQAVELSGGVDSGIVAYDVFRATGTQVLSFGLIVPGPHQQAQKERRAAICAAFYLADTEVQAERNLPFGPGRRLGLHDPSSSYYCEAFDVLSETAAAAGVRTMATGFGGDELMACATDTRPIPTETRVPAWLGGKARTALEWIDDNGAPSAHLSHSTLTALSSHAPGMLSAGIWQVAPLADPRLMRLCRQLPETWVVGKRLIRERLSRELDPTIAGAPSPESFRPLMQRALTRFGLPLLETFLKKGMLLADLGFVEPLILQAAIGTGRRTKNIDSQLADVIRLELGLRKLWSQP